MNDDKRGALVAWLVTAIWLALVGWWGYASWHAPPRPATEIVEIEDADGEVHRIEVDRKYYDRDGDPY